MGSLIVVSRSTWFFLAATASELVPTLARSYHIALQGDYDAANLDASF